MLSNYHRIAAALAAVAGVLLAAAPAIGLDPTKVSTAIGDVQTIAGLAMALLSILGALAGEVHLNVQAMKTRTPTISLSAGTGTSGMPPAPTGSAT